MANIKSLPLLLQFLKWDLVKSFHSFHHPESELFLKHRRNPNGNSNIMGVFCLFCCFVSSLKNNQCL